MTDEDELRTPLDALEALAVQEVELADGLRHLEIYTMSGLLSVFWHGDPTWPHVVTAVGGAMGGVLGPADGLYTDLADHLVDQRIGVLRVGYRKPNDLGRCTHDLLAAIDLASRSGAERVVTIGHSFGGAVAVRAGVAIGDRAAGVVGLSTQSAGCEIGDELEGRVPVLLLHGDRDQILPPMASEMVQMLTGGELEILPGADHLLIGAGDRLRERLGEWIPARFGTAP